MREGFCCDKKLFSFASALLDHLVDGIAQRDPVFVKSCGIDVPDTNFKKFVEQSYEGLFVLDLVGSHVCKWKDLLVGEEESRCLLLLVFLLFFSHQCFKNENFM